MQKVSYIKKILMPPANSIIRLMSCCKVLIYWMGYKYKIYNLTCYIVNFVFTPTQYIQNLQHDT